ncbi:hypothetical protein F4556_006575 [Kitasatospora gansuensis]|uniref:Uncharacterized protein n=1 Tax=Kitasatospora gansuensis TaxID=258050 RepID=A0A7W7SID9_9ACTN|nr:hypothetical protein [Kitasatospora gansuensis]MBB4951040.1 hypothetical protein [Kitasatospora gansuensis]
MNEEISRRLREAAEAHQPDRAQILARMERGAAGGTVKHRTPSIARSWRRAVLAGVVTFGILTTGGLAVAGIVGAPSPPAPVPAVPSPTATPTPTPSAHSTSAPAPATTPSSPRPTPSASSRTQNGPLWSEGSMGPHNTVYWGQSDLVLKTTQPLTSLTVELRIAQTGDVRSTGNWRTLPVDDFTVTVQETGGALVYRWVLKAGRTVPAGQHEFAAQYNHATGTRNTGKDSYRVEAPSSAGSAAVWGGFGPAQ